MRRGTATGRAKVETTTMADVAHAKPHHDYHLVNPSPWPIVGAVSAFIMAVGGIIFMKTRLAGDPNPWILLIIASEVMFFVAWFWAYFDNFFRHGDVEQPARVAFEGVQWPPHGVEL